MKKAVPDRPSLQRDSERPKGIPGGWREEQRLKGNAGASEEFIGANRGRWMSEGRRKTGKSVNERR